MQTLPASAIEKLNRDDKGLFAKITGVTKNSVTIDLKDGFSFTVQTEGDGVKYYIDDTLRFNDLGDVIEKEEAPQSHVKAGSTRTSSSYVKSPL